VILAVLIRVFAVAALVLLSGGLPGDAEVAGDSGPADAEGDGVVDQGR
jgi:hypothetical protein